MKFVLHDYVSPRKEAKTLVLLLSSFGAVYDIIVANKELLNRTNN
jgi:hypothetical protein